jgi:lipopolysaccharide heptosyltransferase II
MSSWETARKILCIRLDTIGDLVMTTPAIHALKACHPDQWITLMTSTAGAVVAPLLPDVDDLIVYDAPWLKATPVRFSSAPDFEMIERLKAAQFDAAVIFTVYSQNPLPAALLCYLAEIPLRLAHCHENPYQLLTHWVKDPEPQERIRHEVQRHLDLVATVGFAVQETALRLNVPLAATEIVKTLLQRSGLVMQQPWLVIHPGATAASRRYPPEQFAVAAQQLATDYGFQIVFTGTPGEQPLVDAIQAAMRAPSLSLVGQLSITELAALLMLAPLLISNNTGPMHIAAAVGTPVVALYALTNPQHTPWTVPNRVLFHDVPCRYCYKSICPEEHHHCLRLVEPRQVVEAVLELGVPVLR